MQQQISQLSNYEVGTILLGEPMAKYTTWNIGGPADALVIPENKGQLATLIRVLYDGRIPWMMVGKGSNMLVSDKGIRGVVIKLGKEFEQTEFRGTEVEAGGGASFVSLSVLAGKKGLTGLEFASGIPGTVGGAVYMNAGAHGSDVSRVFKSAEIVRENGEMVIYGPEEMAFDYRRSVLHGTKGIVTSATFSLAEGNVQEIKASMAAYKERRRSTQPLSEPCAGSVFRNPQGDFAARLIESEGLKGLRVGGAEISAIHANFIVNTGQASAQDVLTLMEQVKETIVENHGIVLVPEVFLVGER